MSASFTAPWPGLGAYMVSKVALEKLIEVWRVEHPAISFTRLVIGDCPGGEGDFATEFANGWDPDLMTEFGTVWFTRGLLAGCFLDVDEMVDAVDALVRSGPSVAVPNMVLAPRPQD